MIARAVLIVCLILLVFGVTTLVGRLLAAETIDKALADADFEQHVDQALAVADWRKPSARYEIAELESWLALPPAVKP